MSKKSVILSCLVVAVVLAHSASAADVSWTNDGPDSNSWCERLNWDPNTSVPGPGDTAIIRQPQRGPVVDCDVDVGSIDGPSNGQVMDIISGTVTIGSWTSDDGSSTINITGTSVVDITAGILQKNGTWTLNISGSPTITVGGGMKLADDNSDWCTVNMSGGSLTVGGRLGWEDHGGGELNVSGGATIECDEFNYSGDSDPWTLNLNGGTVTVVGRLRAPENVEGADKVTMNLDAGTLECGSFDHGTYAYAMDINEGMFIIDGDETAAMNAAVTAGYITAFNDTEDVLVTYEGGKTIVKADYVQVKASQPSPDNYARNQCAVEELSWKPGAEAAVTQGHDVYFGTDIDDVTNATTTVGLGVYKGRQDSNIYPESGALALDLGKKYYWRIDEINGMDTWTGDVWWFTINDGKAWDPYPEDKATAVPRDVELHWTAGCLADSHDVYFGTDWDDVNDATTALDPNNVFLGNQLPTTYILPGELDILTDYYWRIDEVDDGTKRKGEVWSFRSQSAIVDANLVLWYKFDETEGSVASDSSGYEHHGNGHDIAGQWEPNNGQVDGCLDFDAEQNVLVPSNTLDSIGSAITVALWAKGASGQDEDDDMVVFDAGGGDYKLTGIIPTDEPGLDVYWRAGNDSNDLLLWESATPSVWREEWHHFAFVKDESQEKMRIYFDGLVAISKTGTLSTLVNVKDKTFKIGAKTTATSDYDGKLDEFRVYDKVLSNNEIAALFRGDDIGLAWGPTPFNRELDVKRDIVLVWRSGQFAESHDVYLGTSFDDVNDADTSSDVYVGTQGPNEYDPPTDLTLNTTYYWRIDEVNETDPNIWKGKTWKFTVANYIIVDDFESYTSSADMYLKWNDGWNNDTGSTLLLGVAPTDPTHGGDKSQLYSYNNSYDLYYSEAERVLGAGEQDFTEAGVEILTMYFYGKSTNTATTKEQLYAGLYDGGTYAEVRYGAQEGESITDIQIEDWTEWNVALSDFTSVTLGSVDSLFIGFGNRVSPEEGGWGLVYFDDIRLYPSRCVPAKGLMEADLSGDCVVDIADVGIMGMQWLTTDVNFANLGITVTEPSDTDLVGFWKLEGNGNDSSGKGNNGTPEGTYSWVTGYDEVNQAIEFDEGRVLVPDHATLRPTSVVSTACWVYYDGNPGGSPRVVVKGPDNFEAYCIEMAGSYNFTFYVGDVNGMRYWADSDEGDVRPGEWLHIGGTYDGTTVKSYVNGVVVGSTEEANSISLCQDTNGLAIGNRSDADDRPYSGIVDEVRVYNVALSQAEMAWLATDGTGYVPLNSAANLYDEEWEANKSVNMRDYAELMLSWLDEKLWPRDY